MVGWVFFFGFFFQLVNQLKAEREGLVGLEAGCRQPLLERAAGGALCRPGAPTTCPSEKKATPSPPSCRLAPPRAQRPFPLIQNRPTARNRPRRATSWRLTSRATSTTATPASCQR